MPFSDEMIILFHAIFLFTRYFIRALSKSVICSGLCVSPVQVSNFDEAKRKLAKIISEASFDETGSPRFTPPVYVQRYLAVKSVLEDARWLGKIRKVVDFGCAEFGLFPYLKHIDGLQEVLSVDIDEELLNQYKCRAAPLSSDFLKSRREPLEVKVVLGSISDTDNCLCGCDAVICIELIEHLYPDVLEDVPYTVFGFIQPQVAVFTTPNSEFNVIFPDSKGFRHHDHKFEWDREQFECWATNIVERYPEYKVSIQDIGPGPPGTEDVGTCSQMAVFYHSPNHSEMNTVHVQETESYQKYRLLHQYSYQYCVDSRTDEMKIQDEAGYHIRMLSTCDRYMKDDHAEIPLAVLLPTVEAWTTSMATLRKLLEEAGWKLTEEDSENVAVIYSIYCSSESSLEPAADSEWYKETDFAAVDEDWDQEPPCSWHTLKVCSQQMESESDKLCQEASVRNESREWHLSPSEEKLIATYSLNGDALNWNSVQSVHTKETQTAFEDLCSAKESECTKIEKSTTENQGNLCLNLLCEASNGGIDSPMVESVSIDEPNDKLADSGYPNSASAQDMDLDLTPEQVDELFTENDVLTNRSNEDSDSLSISSDNSVDNDGRHFLPIYVPHNEVVFEVLNVENGDVANNNRDGEGNNAVALPLPLLDENLIPLLEAAEDLNNDNEVRIPEHVDPFPHWLLNLLGIANHGAGDAVNLGPGMMDNDNGLGDNNFPVADEGIGDDFNIGSSNTNTPASEHVSDEGLESDNEVEGLPEDPPQEVVFPGDMGAGGEPNIFRGGAEV